MKRLRNWRIAALAAAAVIILALLAWRILYKPTGEAEPPAPSALVSVAPVSAGPVSRTIEAYGVIAGSAAATRTISAPRDVIVQDLLVAPGQPVAAGAPLAVVGDTPASGLAYHQAADALTFAKQDLARIQRLYAQQLAANDQLAAGQKAVADAQAALAAQTAAGGGRARQTIASPIAGVVWQVPAAKGQQLASGAPLLSVVASGGLVAQLGVEPNGAAQLVAGQPVRIVSALDPNRAIESRLTVVGQAVDPTTRLISAMAPAEGAGLALGAAVRGEITVATIQALTAPRASVVYDENGSHVFVIRGGKAHQVAVAAGPEQEDRITVSGEIHAGDQVAVVGAYQLQDGLAVRIAGK
ncbi:MAG TPA: efflux RND transporter periplasmic adaptor subunit [Caulobacteraceae bacterium]